MRFAIAGSAALLGLAIAPATMASATTNTGGGGAAYTCSGGVIPPGVYRSMKITGVCSTPAGNVVIRGDLIIAPGALLDAVAPGDPTTGTPVVPATVNVGRNVFVGAGAVLLFGCSPNISCGPPAPGITYDHVGGSLVAIGAQAVVLHSASIRGSATVVGGGGGTAAQSCNGQPAGQPPIAALEPWSLDPSLDFTPVYTDFEDVTIGGNLTVAHLTSCWLGSLRNQVGGSARFAGNTMGDPDAMEVANNLVKGNMICTNNVPAVQFGDSMAAPNLVRGFGIGECGFKVTQPNPAATPGPSPTPAGIAEHIAVRVRSLRTYVGTYTSTTSQLLPTVTTSSGDQIVAQVGNFALTGRGLKGTGTYSNPPGPAMAGETYLATVYPNGSTRFTVYDVCSCSFHGQTGMVSIRAYGTTSRNGYTSGTFLITSGGGPATGSLSTLAGYGTFSNFRMPSGKLRLIEHLAIS